VEKKMPVFPDLAMKISKSVGSLKEAEDMAIIIQRPYAHLEKEMRRTFSNGNKARVIIDRRMGERRGFVKDMSNDRRRSDRRATKEELPEVVINT
jgi:hypothetical protein